MFTCRPTELVRKAVDELALGLHWYVLYTMVHSAASHLVTPGIKPVHFTISNSVTQLPGQKGLAKQPGTQSFTVSARSVDELLRTMVAYNEQYATLDVRQLLKHVANLNREGPSRYYVPQDQKNAARLATQIRRGVQFFYHRNDVVPPDNSVEATSVEALGRRSKAWADFVMKALSEFVKMIPNITPPKASSYVHYALAELRCAASDHFKSVNSIIKVFECLFHGSPAPAATGPGPVHSMRALLSLRAQCSNDEAFTAAKTLPIDAHFVLMALWTRFGERQNAVGPCGAEVGVVEAEAEDDAGSNVHFKLGKVKRIRVATVKRSSLLTEFDIKKRIQDKVVTNVFLSKHTSHMADPIGITHLDVLNRALDLTLLSLRNVLLCAAQQMQDDHVGVDARAQRGERQAKVLKEMFTNMIELMEKPLRPLDGDDAQGLPPRHDGSVFKETCSSKDKQNLLDVFMEQRGIPAPDMAARFAQLVFFVTCDPHWSDPRFLSEWLLCIRLEGKKLFPAADELKTIRDNCSHAMNLHIPTSLKYGKVVDHINDLLDLVRSISWIL